MKETTIFNREIVNVTGCIYNAYCTKEQCNDQKDTVFQHKRAAVSLKIQGSNLIKEKMLNFRLDQVDLQN